MGCLCCLGCCGCLCWDLGEDRGPPWYLACAGLPVFACDLGSDRCETGWGDDVTYWGPLLVVSFVEMGVEEEEGVGSDSAECGCISGL